MEELIKTIAEILPDKFSLDVLERDYAWLNHAANTPLLGEGSSDGKHVGTV